MATDDAAVELFCELLRHKTISLEGPKGAYVECADFIQAWCERIGLTTFRISPVENKPIVVATWLGTEPELPSVLLNSHYDVVPCEDNNWDMGDPWEASIKDGEVIGRGTQDMKCVIAQYLVAIERMKADGVHMKRTIHLSFLPDEEVGGADGMHKFLTTEEFKGLNVGVALDEGLANETEAYTVFWGERTPWWVIVDATGAVGHGSRFIEDTAVEKLIEVSNKALEFRVKQEQQLGYGWANTDGNGPAGCKHCEAKRLGDVTSLNLTMLQAGVTPDNGKTFNLNVIPATARAGFDIRIATDTPPNDIGAMLDEWCEGEGLSWKFMDNFNPLYEHFLTSLDPTVNPWAGTFLGCFERLGIGVEPEIFPAGTDSRFVRAIGVPCFGFSPIRNTPILLHDHNERLRVSEFTNGIGVYMELIHDMGNAAHALAEKL